MSTILLIVSIFLYYLEVKKLRRELDDLKEQLIFDEEFWSGDSCEEKI